jgi:hypothetical protein
MGTTINTQARQGNGSTEFKLLETDVYRMKIAAATLEEDQYADPQGDGSKPIRLVLRWEVTEATEDQDEDVVGNAVWHRLNPWYGSVRDGGASKFKAFIEQLRDQGLLADFNPQAFDVESLVRIEQRVSVEKYSKTMGPNAGKPGNKVVSVLPLRRTKRAAENGKPPAAKPSAVEDLDLPF